MKSTDNSLNNWSIPVILVAGMVIGAGLVIDVVAIGITYSHYNSKNKLAEKFKKLKAKFSNLEKEHQYQIELNTKTTNLQIENFKQFLFFLEQHFQNTVDNNQKINEEKFQQLLLEFKGNIELIFDNFLNLGLAQIATQAKITNVDQDVHIAMKYNYLLNAKDWAIRLDLPDFIKIISGYLRIMKDEVNMELVKQLQEMDNLDPSGVKPEDDFKTNNSFLNLPLLNYFNTDNIGIPEVGHERKNEDSESDEEQTDMLMGKINEDE